MQRDLNCGVRLDGISLPDERAEIDREPARRIRSRAPETPNFDPHRPRTTHQEARRRTRRGADDAKHVGLGLRQARPRELDPTGLSMSDTWHVLEYLFGFSIIHIEFWASGHDDAPAWAICWTRYDLSNIDNMDRSGGADDSYEPIDGQNDSPRLGTPISKRGAVKRGDTGAAGQNPTTP